MIKSLIPLNSKIHTVCCTPFFFPPKLEEPYLLVHSHGSECSRCGSPLQMKTSRTCLNTRRRYLTCSRSQNVGRCNFFTWYEPPNVRKVEGVDSSFSSSKAGDKSRYEDPQFNEKQCVENLGVRICERSYLTWIYSQICVGVGIRFLYDDSIRMLVSNFDMVFRRLYFPLSIINEVCA